MVYKVVVVTGQAGGCSEREDSDGFRFVFQLAAIRAGKVPALQPDRVEAGHGSEADADVFAFYQPGCSRLNHILMVIHTGSNHHSGGSGVGDGDVIRSGVDCVPYLSHSVTTTL